MLLAYRTELASPKITGTGIEATEFPLLAEEKNVRSVPKIVIDGRPRWEGNVPEPVFVERLLAAISGRG